MADTKGGQAARWSQSHKVCPSWDRSLQFDSVNLESLVIVDQHATVNTFPGLVHTARQAMEAGGTQSQCPNPSGRELFKVKPVTGAKS